MDVVWDAPGPGEWSLDRSHMPGGSTPIVQHIAGEAMPAGMRRVFADLGVPLDTLQAGFVNGHFYSRLRPLVGADRPLRRQPPAAVLKVLIRVHPEMRRRAATASRTLSSEPWLTVIHDWHHGGRAAIVAENAALQATDLAALDDPSLVAHVQACLAHCRRTWEHHFWLHGFDLGPLGRFLYEARDWGTPPAVLLSLLEGASPSTSAPQHELVAIREAVERAGIQPDSLDDVRAIDAETAAALDSYLQRHGAVLFSRYDVDGFTLGERPDMVLVAILGAQIRDTSAAVAARTEEVRERVPAQHREKFDVLLGQAREAMDLRDDNGPVTAEWPMGILRLGLLELGRRLQQHGFVDDPALVLELRPDEIRTDLFTSPPTQDELRRRAELRAAQRVLDAPRRLGRAEPPPPLAVLPESLATLVAMVQTTMAQLGMDGVEDAADHEGAAGVLSGSGIGTEVVRAVARVAASADEALDRLAPGEILVVEGTTPAYNLVLSMAGGVVTAEGGAMSHAAVIARELGISAVIGARRAMTVIGDGDLVELDPRSGTVTVLQHAAQV